MAYTGTPDEISFKQLLEQTLEKNELNGASPYVLKCIKGVSIAICF